MLSSLRKAELNRLRKNFKIGSPKNNPGPRNPRNWSTLEVGGRFEISTITKSVKLYDYLETCIFVNRHFLLRI